MNKDQAKEKALEAIDNYRENLLDFQRDIWAHPELGFKEHRTAEKVADFFEDLGLEYESGIAVTGLRADAKGKNNDVRVAVLGELDAVTCKDHPDADPQSGAVHACGHHSQLAVMLGTAVALTQTGLMDQLAGDVSFIAVPAEEFVELDYRSKIKQEGAIEFFGGKQELIRLGVLDDIDIAAMIHLEGNCPDRIIRVAEGTNGFLGKTVRYVGKEAHAGGAPDQGVNALNAAMLGLMGIHAQRETFRDEDSIRVHPIITRGGDLVNIVPSDVGIETYVRGRSIDAILDANGKVNQALRGGAIAIGAEVEIEEIPGYLPLRTDLGLMDTFNENARNLIGDDNVQVSKHIGGSTDMGDISHMMPAIHPMIGGVEGNAHTRDYRVVDEDMANIVPAKAMAMTIIDLLWDDGAKAKDIVEQFEPVYSKETYLDMWREVVESSTEE
ncbi:MAG: amidohydrolase [Bacillota bacterium]